jgi:toxin ParE1/3/4
MPHFKVKPLAWREINAQVDYLEEHAGLEIAERFLGQPMFSFKALSEMPRMGIRCGFRRPSLIRLRRWPVKDFENWLIFYRPKRNGVEIVHVLHGSRDIENIFDTGL